MGNTGTGAAPAGAAHGSDAPAGVPRSGSSRPTPMLLLVLAAALLVARIGTGIVESRHPPDLPDLVPWQPIREGERRASQELRPVLYDFTADWCAPCQMMKRELFADGNAAKTITSMYVPIRVLDRTREDGHNPPEVDALQARFHVQAFPTLVMVPAGGGPPLVLEGYPGKAQTLKWLSRSGFRASFRMGGMPLPDVSDSSAMKRGGKR